MTIVTKRVSVNGIEMTYDEAGAGERAFVLVHGFTGYRDDFASQLPALAAHGRTLAPDQRGHGDSTNTGDPAGYRFEQLVDDLLAFADATGLGRFDLLGHSMGGMVALRFALTHPDRVASLVLMDTSPHGLNGLARDLFEKGAALARAVGMEKLWEVMRAQGAANERRTAPDRRLEAEWGTERYWQRHHSRVTRMDPEAFGHLGVALVDQPPLTERLGEIGCPTLVVVGEHDTPFLEPSRLMHERIPGARLAVIPEGGHSPQIEAPDAWLAAVTDHLRAVR